MNQFYKKVSSYRIARWVTLSGAIMMAVSPFFRWISLYVRVPQETIRTGVSLLGLVIRGFAGIRQGGGLSMLVPLLLMLCILILAVMTFYLGCIDTIWRGREVYPERFRGSSIGTAVLRYQSMKREYRIGIRMLPLVISILLFILLRHANVYQLVREQYMGSCNSWKEIIQVMRSTQGVKGGISMLSGGMGSFLYFFGNAMFLIGYLLRYVLDTLNEDDFQV